MRKFILFSLVFIGARLVLGQTNAQISYVTVAPTGACQTRSNLRLLTPNGTAYSCQSGVWGILGGPGAGSVTSVSGTTNEIAVATGTTTPVISVAAAFDISGHTSTAPIKKGTSLPATCTVGQFYNKTDATSSAVLYACTATNTWTAQGGGASPAGCPGAGSIQFYLTSSSFGCSLDLIWDNSTVIYAFYENEGTGGLNDLTSGGSYTDGQSNPSAVFTVKISATGTPDSFQWKKNSGAFSSSVPITGAAQNLSNGVTVTFAATTGHTLNNSWTIPTQNGLLVGPADASMDPVLFLYDLPVGARINFINPTTNPDAIGLQLNSQGGNPGLALNVLGANTPYQEAMYTIMYAGANDSSVYAYDGYLDMNGKTGIFGYGYHLGAPSVSGGSTAYYFGFSHNDLSGINLAYYEWFDDNGVYRIKSDNTFNSVYQAIPALYNPQFTKYTPGAANYERIVEQWESNVATIRSENGGTGVLRNIAIDGAEVDLGSATHLVKIQATTFKLGTLTCAVVATVLTCT